METYNHWLEIIRNEGKTGGTGVSGLAVRLPGPANLRLTSSSYADPDITGNAAACFLLG
jgi:hypothetical protein